MNDYFVTFNNKTFNLKLAEPNATVERETFNYSVKKVNRFEYIITVEKKIFTVVLAGCSGNKSLLLINGVYFETEVETSLERKASKVVNQHSILSHKSTVKSPMPGMVFRVKKNIGDQVNQGETVMTLEAMKMENDIKSPFSGVISEIFVAENYAVEKGAKLFSIK